MEQSLERHLDQGQWPGVSMILPVLNEERHLVEAIGALLRQDYPGPVEVILALGPSTDQTDEVAELLRESDPRVRLVANPSGRTPTGLNLAIAASIHDIVARVDGHSVVPSDYLRVAVTTMERTEADNVGGIMAAEGQTPFQRAVAWAMTSRLGVGAAAFHVGGSEGPAETVYLGCFRRSTLDRVGGYDEAFTRAQDWELNHRIRAAGGLVWFTPALRVTYRPRSTVRALALQYLNYGRWRRAVVRTHPETLRRTSSLRYLAPPLTVLGLVAGVSASLGWIAGGSSWLALGSVAPMAYVLLLVVGSLFGVFQAGLAVGVRLPVVLATMHLSWGAGFIHASVFSRRGRSVPRHLRRVDL